MRKSCLKPAQVRKVVKFTKVHQDRIDELFDKPPEVAVAVAEGFEALKTKEEKEVFFAKSKGLGEQESYNVPLQCPSCSTNFKHKIIVDWKKGEVTF